MNIGIRLHDTAPGTLRQRLLFAREQGFSCAHTALSKVVEGFAMQDAPARLTEEFAAQVRADFDFAGMDCAVLGCYLAPADPDAERREKTHAIYRAHLRFAARIGAATVGTETPPPAGARFSAPAPQSEEAFRLLADCLRPLARCAEEEGVCLAVEPVYRHILSTPERAQRLLEEISSPNLRIILDAVNLLSPETASRAREIIDDALRRLGDRVAVLHMKDYVLTPEGAMNACACGLGEMRYGSLLSFAKRRNLPMTLENTVPGNAESARLYLEKTAASL